MPKPVERESQVKLMFVTPTGPVLGTAEMLKPVSWSQQPFRFVSLEHDDQRRLQASIQTSFGQMAKKEDEQKNGSRSTAPPWIAAGPAKAAFQLAPRGLYPGHAFFGSAIYLFGIFDVLFLHLK